MGKARAGMGATKKAINPVYRKGVGPGFGGDRHYYPLAGYDEDALLSAQPTTGCTGERLFCGIDLHDIRSDNEMITDHTEKFGLREWSLAHG